MTLFGSTFSTLLVKSFLPTAAGTPVKLTFHPHSGAGCRWSTTPDGSAGIPPDRYAGWHPFRGACPQPRLDLQKMKMGLPLPDLNALPPESARIHGPGPGAEHRQCGSHGPE